VPSALSLAALAAATLTLTACVGSTGGDLFPLAATARGAPASGESFVNGKGYRVTLTRADVLVGALYLNRTLPTSVSSGTSCTLNGVYVAEVPGPVVVDALSSEPQPFPSVGEATADRALTGEVWLTSGNVDEPDDPSVILDVAGDVELAGGIRSFEGQLTIGANRLGPTPAAEPGLKPICKERIVSPIPVDLRPARGDHLALTIDPTRMLANVDFATLEPDDDGTFRFADDPASATQASTNLYVGLRATGVYTLELDR
jgi:hypothetical protein